MLSISMWPRFLKISCIVSFAAFGFVAPLSAAAGRYTDSITVTVTY